MPLLDAPAPLALLPDIAAHTRARDLWAKHEAARRARYERDRSAWLKDPPPELEIPVVEPPIGTDEHEDWVAAWEKRKAWASRGARLMQPFRPRPFQVPILEADRDVQQPPPRPQSIELQDGRAQIVALPEPAAKRGTKARNPIAKLLTQKHQRGQLWHRAIPRRLVEHRKSKAIGTPPLRADEKQAAKDLAPLKRLLVLRPHDRVECRNTVRPCPWVGCSMHLYLDVNPSNGSIKFNFPGLEIEDLEETCAYDVHERGELQTLEEVGRLMNLTLERTRQIEKSGTEKLRHLMDPDAKPVEDSGYGDDFDDPPDETQDVKPEEDSGW